MDRKTTPEIEEMERVMEEGREARRSDKTLKACPYGQSSRRRGYWRLGWFQADDALRLEDVVDTGQESG